MLVIKGEFAVQCPVSIPQAVKESKSLGCHTVTEVYSLPLARVLLC